MGTQLGKLPALAVLLADVMDRDQQLLFAVEGQAR